MKMKQYPPIIIIQSLDDLLETANPIVRTSTKKNTIIILSITLNSITNLNLKLFFF